MSTGLDTAPFMKTHLPETFPCQHPNQPAGRLCQCTVFKQYLIHGK